MTTFPNSEVMPGPLSAHAGHYLLKEIVAVNAATVEFVTGIDDTYKKYLVTGVGVRPGTTTQTLRVRCSTDGGATWANSSSDYTYAVHAIAPSLHTYTAAAVDGYGRISYNSMENDAVCSLSFDLTMYDPSNTSLYTLMEHSGASQYNTPSTSMNALTGANTFRHADAVNGLQFLFGAGTIYGTFKLYGIK